MAGSSDPNQPYHWCRIIGDVLRLSTAIGVALTTGLKLNRYMIVRDGHWKETESYVIEKKV